jgi:hypothetical protein
VGLVLLLVAACGAEDPDRAAPASEFDRNVFERPLMEHRPWVRWWWPGGAVDATGIEAELATLAARGFGGVEVQSFSYGIPAVDLERPGVKTWGSAAFFEAISAADRAATERGLGLDLGFGSAWPAGAPSIDEAPAQQLVLGSVDVTGPLRFTAQAPPPKQQMSSALAIGRIGTFDENVVRVAVLAARLLDAAAHPPLLDDFRDITSAVDGGGWDVPEGTWRVFAVYRNQSRQLVNTAAYPSDAPVVDHLDFDGLHEVLREVADPLLDAAPHAAGVFVDSFELSAELPWTPELLERFRAIKGYDPTPLLPLLFFEGGEPEQLKIFDALAPRFAAPGQQARVREDYEDVRGELFLEFHVKPLRSWAGSRDVALRLQAHGGFADELDAYAEAHIPESEGLAARGTYDFLKLAASGGHVAGRTIISSESFVGLTADPRGLTLDDFYLLAGRAFSAGINRLVHHGYAYRFAQSDGRAWYPWDSGITFASALGESHPLWPSLPELNLSFARTAYAMTRGQHVADLAWLEQDGSHRNGVASFPEALTPRAGQSPTSRAVQQAGYVYDRVSRRGLAGSRVEANASARPVLRVGAASYRALLIEALDAASPELLAAIESAAAGGVPVLVLGELPKRAWGYADHERRDDSVRSASARLSAGVTSLAAATEIGSALANAGVVPSVQPAGGGALAVSVEHRATPHEHVLLLFNESDAAVTESLRVNLDVTKVQVFDPEQAKPLTTRRLATGGTLDVELPARRWRILVLNRSR